MAKLAAGRDTHLTPAEIVAEALLQFDARRGEPTIRSLAAALRVTPTAIYHHFSSQAAIFQGVVELVWGEAATETLRLVPKPLAADPIDALLAAGTATRQAWLAHPRVARYMAATPEANHFVTNALGLMANLFERLELEHDDAAACFHSYCTFMIGAVLFAATRRAADDQLAHQTPIAPMQAPKPPARPTRKGDPNEQTRTSISAVMNLSTTDPARDEELFQQGLRRLIHSFMPEPG